MNVDIQAIRRIIPSVLVVYCENKDVAEGIVHGINSTLDALQKNHCDVFIRKPPEIEYTPATNEPDGRGMYKVRARFAVASALEGKEGRKIMTNSSFYEEEINDSFDILNNKGLA
jgi:hypothetical protein